MIERQKHWANVSKDAKFAFAYSLLQTGARPYAQFSSVWIMNRKEHIFGKHKLYSFINPNWADKCILHCVYPHIYHEVNTDSDWSDAFEEMIVRIEEYEKTQRFSNAMRKIFDLEYWWYRITKGNKNE